MKFLIVISLTFFTFYCQNKDKNPPTKIITAIVALNYLDTMCNYRILETKITEIPTITIPANGKYRICGSVDGTVRLIFEDYTKSYSVTGKSGKVSNGCPGSTPSTSFNNIVEADTLTQKFSEIFNSENNPNIQFQPLKSKNYTSSVYSGSIGSTVCSQGSSPRSTKTDTQILFTIN